jgi:hypothetical protein
LRAWRRGRRSGGATFDRPAELFETWSHHDDLSVVS